MRSALRVGDPLCTPCEGSDHVGCCLFSVGGHKLEARDVDMSADNDSPPPTSAVLMSISKHLATKCNKQSKDYIECKRRDKNPESCIREGDTVTACAIDA